VTKWRRARIFEDALTFVTTLPRVAVLTHVYLGSLKIASLNCSWRN
jgi:hypothetical protein